MAKELEVLLLDVEVGEDVDSTNPFLASDRAQQVERVGLGGRLDFGQQVVDPAGDGDELDLVVAGSKDAVYMLEAGAQEVEEEVLVQALLLAQEQIRRVCELQVQLRDELGVSRKYALPLANELDARGITRRRGDLRIGGPRLPG